MLRIGAETVWLGSLRLCSTGLALSPLSQPPAPDPISPLVCHVRFGRFHTRCNKSEMTSLLGSAFGQALAVPSTSEPCYAQDEKWGGHLNPQMPLMGTSSRDASVLSAFEL